MGKASSKKLWQSILGKKEIRVVMVGLDVSGKTTILYKLSRGRLQTTIPRIGFFVETAKYKNIRFTSFDVGGGCAIRPLWSRFYTNMHGIIFVVDSDDRPRIEYARDELQRILAEDELRGAALLVFANKQDLPNAMRVPEVTQVLGLDTLRNRVWHIQATCATNGCGINEGLEWLSNFLSKSDKSNSA